MKIISLCDNIALNENFGCEHGLSLYIEEGGVKILFDSGQSDLFLKNAEKLGVDLSKVDFFVLSHGHYDHGGGLEDFLEINQKAKIYLSEYAFLDYYNKDNKYIGLPKELSNSQRLVFTKGTYRLCENIELCTLNGAELKKEIDSAMLKKMGENGLEADDFLHEQYLNIKKGGRVYLISGCSHKGILNIADTFRPDVLVGGFHLKDKEAKKDNPEFTILADELLSYDTTYYTCHCTGEEQYNIMKEKMKDKLYYLPAGKIVDI